MVQAKNLSVWLVSRKSGTPSRPRVIGATMGERIPLVNGLIGEPVACRAMFPLAPVGPEHATAAGLLPIGRTRPPRARVAR
jgi:hypothetical protein